jgi:UDP-glucuronate decarboxylase
MTGSVALLDESSGRAQSNGSRSSFPVSQDFPEVIRDDLPRIAERLVRHVGALAGRSVLVTGASGMLPAYLADVLAYLNDSGALPAPCRLLLLARSPERLHRRLGHLLGRADVTVLQRDVREPLPTDLDFDYLVHAASPATPKDFLGDPLGSLDANTLGLRRLLEHARSVSAASVLYVSSSEVYGTPDPGAIPTPETYVGRVDPLSRRAYYAEAKRAGETYCLAYHDVHRVPVKIARPFHVHGPGVRPDDGRVVAALIAMGLRGERLALESDGLATRTYGYVADAVVALLRILLSDRDGEAFNVGSDRPETSVLSLAREIASLFHQREPVLVSQAPADGRARGAPARACPDINKLRQTFQFEPEIDLRDGLARTIRWCLAS